MREGVGEAAENPLNQMKRSYQRYKGHLGAGAAVDAAAQGGAAPLFIAEQQGCREALERLPGAGAVAEAAKKDGSTPLLIAAPRSESRGVQ